MTQRPSSFALGGGLDLVSPALAVGPGRLVAALNYEPLAEGYGRVSGYERCDGRTLPSRAPFFSMPFTLGYVPFGQGATVTGSSSGAVGYVLLEPYAPTGSWAFGSAGGTLVLGAVTGTFQPGEVLRANGVPSAQVSGIAARDSAPTEAARTAWGIAARERQRELIGKVPGIGPVRGVAIRKGDLYAFRDQDGSRAAMFKATATGWQEVAASYVLSFTKGEVELSEGAVVKQGSATATVLRVVRQSGTYVAKDFAGYYVLTNPSGGFASGNVTNASGAIVGKIAGPAVRFQLAAGGKYHVIGHNFFGTANRYSLYGANGVNRAFEFDGTFLSPITTNSPDDRPTRVAEIAQSLILTFPGGSIQISEVGEPFGWDGANGAVELALGDDVTDVLQASETAVLFFGRSKVATLTGTDADTFAMGEISEEAGAMPWTAQRLGTAIYLDEGGLRTASSTSAFGNFKTGSLTEVIAPLLEAKIRTGAQPVASLVCKRKGQYRVYWDDRTGLAVYTGRKQAESIPFALDDMQPFTVTTGELTDGSEGMFAGAEDGYVYRLDSGPSFDGAGVRGFAMLPYNHLGAVMTNKRYHAVSLEMVAAPTTRIGLTAQFDYGDGTNPADGDRNFTVSGGGREFIVQGGGGVWDQATWNDFYWSAPFSGTAEAPIDGMGRNVSILIGAISEPLEEPHVLQAYHIFWSPRGTKRVG